MSARTMSPDLIAFLKAWYDWATNGAPDGEPFWRECGLCTNAYFFRRGVEQILRDRFGDEFGDECETPFGSQDYTRRALNDTQHECPKRLAWVRERLVEAGELVA